MRSLQILEFQSRGAVNRSQACLFDHRVPDPCLARLETEGEGAADRDEVPIGSNTTRPFSPPVPGSDVSSDDALVAMVNIMEDEQSESSGSGSQGVDEAPSLSQQEPTEGSTDDDWPGPISREPLSRRPPLAPSSGVPRPVAARRHPLDPVGASDLRVRPLPTPPGDGAPGAGTEGSSVASGRSAFGGDRGATSEDLSRTESPLRRTNELIRDAVVAFSAGAAAARGAAALGGTEAEREAGAGTRPGRLRFRALVERPVIPEVRGPGPCFRRRRVLGRGGAV